LVPEEISCAGLSDVLKIINHAHAIFCSIPLVQMLQLITRRAVTTEAVYGSASRYFLAVLDSAQDAHLRFETIVNSTAGARFFISYVCVTEAAVHSTGSYQRRKNRICFCLWRHVSNQRLFYAHLQPIGNPQLFRLQIGNRQGCDV
jgi:hypothetical protein